MNEPIIEITDVRKKYTLGTIDSGDLLKDVVSFFKSGIAKKKNLLENEKEFYALDGINLKIQSGQRIGLIGANGAGKSTLLKILSRVTAPTEGRIEIGGRISSMLEVGTGFHGELTGRENIYLNGAILGMTKKEIASKIDSIIEFSEIGKFIDTPIKRYSSGMYVKLAFSIAAHLDSEILIMDEILAVGDIAFQKKCLEKMNELSANQQRTILYVSHNMNTIRTLCDRCVVMNKGKIIFDGDVESGIEKYSQVNSTQKSFYDYKNYKRDDFFTNYKAIILSSEFLNNENSYVEYSEKLKIKLKIQFNKKIEKCYFQVLIKKLDNSPCGSAFSESFAGADANSQKDFTFALDTQSIAPGKYLMSFILFKPDGYGEKEQFDLVKDAMFFEVISTKGKLEHNWHSIWGETVYPRMMVKEV